MANTQENIQFSESVVKYNLINFLNFNRRVQIASNIIMVVIHSI